MVQQQTSSDQLNATFSALADPTRRAILARLASGETSVSELAEPFEMSMPAISKHLKVLQRAGLIERGREAQWRPCRLAAGPLKDASDWLEHYRRFWEEAFDRLEDYLRELQRKRGEKEGAKKNGPQEVIQPPNRPNCALDCHSRLRRATRTGVEGAHRARAPRTMVGAERLHLAHPQTRTTPRRYFSLQPAKRRRPRDVGKWVYREIVAPEHLVIVSSFTDEKGNQAHNPFDPNWPLEMLTGSTFTEHQARTTITIRMTPINATASERKTFDDGRNSDGTGVCRHIREARPIPGNALRRNHQLAER